MKATTPFLNRTKRTYGEVLAQQIVNALKQLPEDRRLIAARKAVAQ